MRRVVAILFSLVLLLSQGLSLAATPGIRPACACCDCNRASCCEQPASPSNEPFSKAPVPRCSPTAPLLVAALFQYELPSGSSSPNAEAGSLAAHSLSVPLFQQNCSLLI